MIGHITVTSASGSGANTSKGSGYGDLTNFTVTLGGRDIVGLGAAGIIILVALMLILARPGRSGGS
jgi:hypothetical protein